MGTWESPVIGYVPMPSPILFNRSSEEYVYHVHYYQAYGYHSSCFQQFSPFSLFEKSIVLLYDADSFLSI